MSLPFRKLRPAKVRGAVRRRWFERRVARTTLTPLPGLTDVGTPYGGWTTPGQLIDDSWLCYCIGAGGDVSFDLALTDRYGATVRSVEPVAGYVEEARRSAAGRVRFSAYQASIATADGPVRLQPRAAQPVTVGCGLYDTDRYIEVPGRALESLMTELGDDRMDLLKLDIEGSESDVVPTLDLRALGVRLFATQLHHTASVRAARSLIEQVRSQGYQPVAIRPVLKITFLRDDQFAPAIGALSQPGTNGSPGSRR